MAGMRVPMEVPLIGAKMADSSVPPIPQGWKTGTTSDGKVFVELNHYDGLQAFQIRVPPEVAVRLLGGLAQAIANLRPDLIQAGNPNAGPIGNGQPSG